ncbi:hypothetical protein, partial [Agromyces bauzanensis]|uniref:hypothetical protein n=1 Tax=Agromyces bauzanensis TaxID=1308924 RepID=UPI001E36C5E7
FPLPLEIKQHTGRMILLWQVRGARIRDPKPSWLQKHREYEAEHYPGLDTARIRPGSPDAAGLSTM